MSARTRRRKNGNNKNKPVINARPMPDGKFLPADLVYIILDYLDYSSINMADKTETLIKEMFAVMYICGIDEDRYKRKNCEPIIFQYMPRHTDKHDHLDDCLVNTVSTVRYEHRKYYHNDKETGLKIEKDSACPELKMDTNLVDILYKLGTMQKVPKLHTLIVGKVELDTEIIISDCVKYLDIFELSHIVVDSSYFSSFRETDFSRFARLEKITCNPTFLSKLINEGKNFQKISANIRSIDLVLNDKRRYSNRGFVAMINNIFKNVTSQTYLETGEPATPRMHSCLEEISIHIDTDDIGLLDRLFIPSYKFHIYLRGKVNKFDCQELPHGTYTYLSIHLDHDKTIDNPLYVNLKKLPERVTDLHIHAQYVCFMPRGKDDKPLNHIGALSVAICGLPASETWRSLFPRLTSLSYSGDMSEASKLPINLRELYVISQFAKKEVVNYSDTKLEILVIRTYMDADKSAADNLDINITVPEGAFASFVINTFSTKDNCLKLLSQLMI